MNSYELVVMSGPDSGAVLPMQIGRQTIGRSNVAGLTIDDPSVKPHHGLLDWNPPHLECRALGGVLQVHNGGQVPTVAIGESWCEVRHAQQSAERPPAIFHRVLHENQESLLAPKRPELEPEPPAPMSPPMVPIVSGAVLGVVMAVVTKQMLFGLFAMTTGLIALLTWGVSSVSYRRSMIRWRHKALCATEKFHQQNIEFTKALVERRRYRHTSIGRLRVSVENGDAQLWTHRKLDEVCVGVEAREVMLKDDEQPIVITHYPRSVNIAAGKILGIYGMRARQCVTALIARLAVEIGPADWQLIFASDVDDEWKFLKEFVQVRSTPLDRFDLESAGYENKHRLIFVHEKETIANRTSIARRILHNQNVSMIVVAPSRLDLSALCSDSLNADESGIDGMSETTARHFAQALRRWIDPDNDGSFVPKEVPFSTSVKNSQLSSQSIATYWQQQDRDCLSVILGESADGPIAIDLVNDGPHAVVVGTTGSGKSDFLRTWVIGLALQYSPNDVTFILIDYKGGAAFDSCMNLPHVVGVITDLDVGLAERVLVSLEAELRYREQQLRNDSKIRLSRLVVVVDELAALKEDVPNFIGSLVGIAQRGRSLGIHLIVATQRPGSALSADVLANANIRLALRVQSSHDSSEIVGSNVAASFSRDTPGRAVLRLGSDELYVFQATHLDIDIESLVITVNESRALVEIPDPRRPWLDALPNQLVAKEIASTRLMHNSEVVIGLVDDPMHQQQVPLLWELSQHVLIFGSAKTGKTSALTMMRQQSVAREAQVFSISCSGLRSSTAQHIDVSDRELLRRLLLMMIKRIDGPPVLDEEEQWVLFIDDIDIWRNHFIDDRIGLEIWTMFERIFLEGPSHRIACVISGIQATAIPAMLSSRVKQKWALTSPPGRCVVDCDGRELFAQLLAPENGGSSPRPVLASQPELRHLPRVITSDSLQQAESWAVLADDLTEVCLPFGRGIAILGARHSGRTMVMGAMQHAWEQVHPLGRVIDLRQHTEIVNVKGEFDQKPTLILADESTAYSHIADFLNQAALSSGNVTLIASASPNFVRAHPEHWFNTLRRSRTGMLLGRAAVDEADLLGLYTSQPHVYGEAKGRGLWVVDGCPIGIAQSASAKFEAVA